MSVGFRWRVEGLLGVSSGDGGEEVGGERGGTASARVSRLDEGEEGEKEENEVVGGRGMSSLESRVAVVFVVGVRWISSLESRVLVVVAVDGRGMSSLESRVVVVLVLSSEFW